MKKILSSIVLFTTIFLTLTLTSQAITPPNDINNHWAKDTIIWNIEHKYMQGTSTTTFSPNAYVTRAQLTQVLYNIENKPQTPTTTQFQDINKHWAYDSIVWANNNNIVTGTSTKTFSPNQNITREQATTMFHRYHVYKTNDTTTLDYNYFNTFTDTNSISQFAKEHMCWAIQFGIINGSDNKLNPKKFLTRAELAQLIKNYMEPKQVDPPSNIPQDIKETIQKSDVTQYNKYFDCCNSTQLEREVMLILTDVKFKNLTTSDKTRYTNELWHDPRYISKTTVNECATEHTLLTQRMLKYQTPKNYFESIYSEHNLHTAPYLDSFWYYVIQLDDLKPQSIASQFLSNPSFRQDFTDSDFSFYGIYIDTKNKLACISHGNATAIK